MDEWRLDISPDIMNRFTENMLSKPEQFWLDAHTAVAGAHLDILNSAQAPNRTLHPPWDPIIEPEADDSSSNASSVSNHSGRSTCSSHSTATRSSNPTTMVDEDEAEAVVTMTTPVSNFLRSLSLFERDAHMEQVNAFLARLGIEVKDFVLKDLKEKTLCECIEEGDLVRCCEFCDNQVCERCSFDVKQFFEHTENNEPLPLGKGVHSRRIRTVCDADDCWGGVTAKLEHNCRCAEYNIFGVWCKRCTVRILIQLVTYKPAKIEIDKIGQREVAYFCNCMAPSAENVRICRFCKCLDRDQRIHELLGDTLVSPTAMPEVLRTVSGDVVDL